MRFCPFCCSEVGDEKHFFMDCQATDIVNSRNQLPLSLSDQNPYDEMVTVLKTVQPEKLLAVGNHIRTIELFLKE